MFGKWNLLDGFLPAPEAPVTELTITESVWMSPSFSRGAIARIAPVGKQPGLATKLVPLICLRNSSGRP